MVWWFWTVIVSESLSACGRKLFLMSLGNGQGKLCKLIVFAFLRAFWVLFWSYLESRNTVYLCSSLCQRMELMLSLFAHGRKGSAFHSSPCFHVWKFPRCYSGCWHFPNPESCSKFGGTVVSNLFCHFWVRELIIFIFRPQNIYISDSSGTTSIK